MAQQWQLQEAKNRFSEVVERACSEGAQTVTKRGKPAVVVVSVDEYQKLVQRQTGLVEFFRKSPLRGVDLDLARPQDLPREVDL